MEKSTEEQILQNLEEMNTSLRLILQFMENLSSCNISQVVVTKEVVTEETVTKELDDFAIEKRVTLILKKLGFSMLNRVAFCYLREAIVLCVKDPDRLHNITKSVYSEIAIQHHCTTNAVSHGIFACIEKAYIEKNRESFKRLFGYDIFLHEGRPSPKDFISTITDYILLH